MPSLPNFIFFCSHFIFFCISLSEARAVLVHCHGNAMLLQHVRSLAEVYARHLRVHVLAFEIPGTQYDWVKKSFAMACLG